MEVTNLQSVTPASDVEEVNSNSYLENESDEYDLGLFYKPNSDIETLIGEDSADLEAQFDGNSEAALRG